MTLLHYRPPTKWKPDNVRRGFPYFKVGNRAEWGDDHAIDKFRKVAASEAQAPAHFVGWIEFPFGVELDPKDMTSDEERYAITLSPAPGASWARQTGLCDFARRCWAEADAEEYSADADAHCFQLAPAPAYGEAANVINGWNRRFATNPVNAWVAEPGLPQTLTLEWDEAKAFSAVHLVFDTLTRAYQQMPFNCAQRVSPMCVRDYALHARVGGEWVRVAEAADNYRRRRVHQLERVSADALRLTVKRVWDEAQPARVYEVRVYDE